MSRQPRAAHRLPRQRDELVDTHTVREAVLGGRVRPRVGRGRRAPARWSRCCWPASTLDRAVDGLSGGERRRCSLAALLLGEHDLVVLDEPTNHLDVEAVAWLADHLARRSSALVVVTHDRWFLDAVCQWTWEVHDGVVDVYEGGYAVVRARQGRAAAAGARPPRCAGSNLVRKELAWLRRGPPARTSKPKFRIDAANALIEDVPDAAGPAGAAAVRHPAARQGRHRRRGRRPRRGDRSLLSHATWRLGPGDRVGIVGVNGAGKTSVLGLLSGDARAGRRAGAARPHGRAAAPDPARSTSSTPRRGCCDGRVDPAGDPDRATARSPRPSMLERFGFTGDRLTARLGDLSGGERRRFQLLRLLLTEPNVLLLDEPTNDLDIETLNVVEDFLDGWPGTLVVVSHDRYFLERVTDTVWALLGDGQISMLPARRGRVPRAPCRRPSTSPSRRPDEQRRRVGRAERASCPGRRRAAPRSARRARRSRASRGSSSGSAYARSSCNAAIVEPARTTSGWRSSAPSSRRWPPSGTRSSWSGSRPPRHSMS